MSEERKPFIVGARRVQPTQRMTYAKYCGPENFENIAGANEDAPVGAPVQYVAYLTEEGRAAFQREVDDPNSNAGYLEEDVTDSADMPEDVFMPPEGAERVASVPEGVERAALNYQDVAGLKANGVLVAVLDTGASYYHVGRYFKGRIANRFYWVTDSSDDRNGHGTWCAGAALPPGAKLVVHKVLNNEGTGSRSTIIRAMQHFYSQCATAGKPGVCSMSLSGDGYSAAYEDAIQQGLSKGVVTVCSAGNNGRERGHKVGAPANSPSALAVGAFDHRDNRKADFSSTGSEVDCVGAGVSVLGLGLNGKDSRLSGTSMSCPIVARSVACLLSEEEGVRKVRQALLSACVDTAAPVNWEGHGVVRARAALKKLQPAPKPAPKEPAAYYPGVPREERWTWVLKNVPNEKKVLTWKGHDLGIWIPRG